jgi:hypothetical protein
MFDGAAFVEADGVVNMPEGTSAQAVRSNLRFLYTGDAGLVRFSTNDGVFFLQLFFTNGEFYPNVTPIQVVWPS